MTSSPDFAAFDAMCETLHDAPRFPVEPRDKGSADEKSRQMTLLALLRRSPGITVWAIHNEGRRTQWEQRHAKSLGLVAGAADLVVFWNRGVAAIEMKGGQTAVSAAQVEQLNRLHDAGHHVAVFRDPMTAAAWLREIGAPVKAVRG